MGDGESALVQTASFRIAEFSDALDWRPMLFQEPVIAQRACTLCGVLYKKVVRLPCAHTLCTKCHALMVGAGSACPVDQEQFCEDDVEPLELSLKYILDRKVACWNAPRGCSFIGRAVSLLDHYKECDFSIVPCCMCRSSVLGSHISEHLKSDCSFHRTTSTPKDNPATQGLKDISRASLEMKTAMGKISEALMSLQTSMNQCSENIKAEGARLKDQWEGEASRLTEQLNHLSTFCTTGFAEEVRVLEAAVADYEGHVDKELCLQRDKSTVVLDAVSPSLLGDCGPKKVHWYIKCWADLKKEAIGEGSKSLNSPKWTIHGYSVSQLIVLGRHCGTSTSLSFKCLLQLHPGRKNFLLEWPFRKVFTFGVIHPKDQLNFISEKINASRYGGHQCFQRPVEIENTVTICGTLSTAEKLENYGFIQNDMLHVFLEIAP